MAISCEQLQDSNKSARTENKRRQWYQIKAEHGLYVLETCPDARIAVTDGNTYLIRSINVAGPKDPYVNLYNDEHVGGIATLSHYSASLTIPGQRPRGCGGADACEAAQNGHPALPDIRLQGYVERIDHKDPLLQSLNAASQIAKLTGQVTMAAYIEHESSTVKPLGWFDSEGEDAHLPEGMLLHDLSSDNYNPEQIYRNGLPEYKRPLPDIHEKFLSDQVTYVQELHNRYPDIHKQLVVQNPHSLVMSTSPSPLGARYDEYEEPGRAFAVSMARKKIKESALVTKKDRRIAFDQAAYAMIQAIANSKKPDKPFSNLDTVLIESPSFNLSEDIAGQMLRERAWARQFAALPGKQFLIAETRSGIVHKMANFLIEAF